MMFAAPVDRLETSRQPEHRVRVALGTRAAYLLADRKPAKARAMQSLFQILMLILDVVWFIIIAHVIISWLINFQVLNLRQPLVAQIWDGLGRLLEPLYQPIRRILPQMGGLDLAPLVALIGVYAIRIILANNAGFFYGY
jgi:YggT family protein